MAERTSRSRWRARTAASLVLALAAPAAWAAPPDEGFSSWPAPATDCTEDAPTVSCEGSAVRDGDANDHVALFASVQGDPLGIGRSLAYAVVFDTVTVPRSRGDSEHRSIEISLDVHDISVSPSLSSSVARGVAYLNVCVIGNSWPECVQRAQFRLADTAGEGDPCTGVQTFTVPVPEDLRRRPVDVKLDVVAYAAVGDADGGLPSPAQMATTFDLTVLGMHAGRGGPTEPTPPCGGPGILL